jgi:rhodanese-related sulfurtransferase
MLNPITPTAAARMIQSGRALLVDVREANEFAAAHVAGAVSHPLSLANSGLLSCAATMPVIFTCQSGQRTVDNAGRLAKMVPEGMAQFVLEGGLNGWTRSGLPLSGPDASRPLPLMRQVQLVAGLLVLTGVALGFLIAPAWFGLAAFVGAGLSFAGASGWCGMARLLAVMPWNRAAA